MNETKSDRYGLFMHFCDLTHVIEQMQWSKKNNIKEQKLMHAKKVALTRTIGNHV